METRSGRRLALILGALLIALPGCSRGREYELRGQVLVVDAARKELTIAHDDIPGFMPGMTMPFKVQSETLLDGRTPGELVRATLVVEDTTAYLTAVVSTGRAPLPAGAPTGPRVALLEPGAPVPDGSFIDQTGAARTLADWRGRTLALTFIYTRCPIPDFCPLMDRRFAEVQELLAADAALGGRVHLASISFDPDFDTPAVLAAHAQKVGADPARWSFLTGARPEIERFSAPLGVSLIPDATHPSEIVHNLRTAVVDRQGRLVTILNGNEWTAGELLAAIRSSDAAQ
jgi:protein SCO1